MKIEMPEELKLFAGDHFFQMVLLIVISCGCMFMLVVLEAYLSFFLFAGGVLILGAVEFVMIRRDVRELAMILDEKNVLCLAVFSAAMKMFDERKGG